MTERLQCYCDLLIDCVCRHCVERVSTDVFERGSGRYHHYFKKSSCLDTIDYNVAAKTLLVEFVASSDLYLYFDVEKSEVVGLLQAESAGTYFNGRIQRNHKCVKVRELPELPEEVD